MRQANKSDKQLVIQILSQSFDQNLSVNYVIKQDSKRKARLRLLIAYSFSVAIRSGKVFISDDEKACCLLIESDQQKTTVKSLFEDLKLAFSAIGASRVATIMKKEKLIKKYHPPQPFFHLWYIGVLIEHSGKGLGSALLEEVIDFCRNHQKDIYLETSTARNLPFYKNNGFELFEKVEAPYQLYFFRKLFHKSD